MLLRLETTKISTTKSVREAGGMGLCRFLPPEFGNFTDFPVGAKVKIRLSNPLLLQFSPQTSLMYEQVKFLKIN